MEATPMIRELIHESILSILGAQDASHPQLSTVYYLDPIECKIRWYTQATQASTSACDENWVHVLTAHPRAIPQSIVDNLLKLEMSFAADCEQFQKDGKWKNKPVYSTYRINVTVYYPPEKWFDAFDLHNIRWQAKKGMGAEEILAGFDLGGNVDYQEALDWIKKVIHQKKRQKKHR